MATDSSTQITQVEAMRRALTALGEDASYDDLIEHVKKQFSIDIDKKYISQLKSTARKSLAPKDAKPAKPTQPAKKPAPKKVAPSYFGPPPADSPPATPPGITPNLLHNLDDILKDLEAIRAIADRIGGDGVRRILALLGK